MNKLEVVYVDTPEHRAAVYALNTVPEMREWAKRDFLEWLESVKAEAWDEGCAAEYADYTSEGPKNPYRREAS